MTVGFAELGPSDAVVVVDVQKDFCPGGALPVEGGDQVVPVLNRWTDATGDDVSAVMASRDWHPRNHISFHERGGSWPPHCIQGTPGAAFHPDLRLPDYAWVVSKGADPDRDQYSAFDGTGLAERLRDRSVRRLWAGGLAQDVCVRATVLDALRAGFEVHLIESATRAVNVQPDDGRKAVEEMRSAGAAIEEEQADG